VVGNLNAEQREIARILQENSIELRKLIEGLLNYSAVHAQTLVPRRAVVPLNDLVRRVLNDRKLAIVAKGIRIELDTENVAAYCDEGKIRVVLDNLLSNAIKFSPEKASSRSALQGPAATRCSRWPTRGPASPSPSARRCSRRSTAGSRRRSPR
jgi:two-component system sensor histidine kinase GlrK